MIIQWGSRFAATPFVKGFCMVYTEKYVTKWHDAAPDLCLRPSAILVYLEETSGLHMRSVGRSLDELHIKERKGFILSRIGIVFHKKIEAYSEITVNTFTGASAGFSSPRYFEMFSNGDKVAEATSIWALVDLESHRPIKVSDFDFGFEHEARELEGIPTRVSIPKTTEFAVVGTREIRYSDVDYNGHMNNTKYPDMLMDYIPEPETVTLRSMVLSFRHEATLGHTLTVERAETEGGYLFRTVDSDGTVCLEAEVKLER